MMPEINLFLCSFNVIYKFKMNNWSHPSPDLIKWCWATKIKLKTVQAGCKSWLWLLRGHMVYWNNKSYKPFSSCSTERGLIRLLMCETWQRNEWSTLYRQTTDYHEYVIGNNAIVKYWNKYRPSYPAADRAPQWNILCLLAVRHPKFTTEEFTSQ